MSEIHKTNGTHSERKDFIFRKFRECFFFPNETRRICNVIRVMNDFSSLCCIWPMFSDQSRMSNIDFDPPLKRCPKIESLMKPTCSTNMPQLKLLVQPVPNNS